MTAVTKTREFHNNSDDQFPLHFFDRDTYVPNGSVEGLEFHTTTSSEPFANDFTVEQVSNHLTKCLLSKGGDDHEEFNMARQIYNGFQLKEYSATELFNLFCDICDSVKASDMLGMYPIHRRDPATSIPHMISTFATMIGFTYTAETHQSIITTTLEDAREYFEKTLLPYAQEHKCRFFREFDQNQVKGSTPFYIGDFSNRFYMCVRDNHHVIMIGFYDFD